MTAKPGELTLYEVVDAHGASISPFVWRIRFALAQKGLAANIVGLAYADIPGVAAGETKTVPILERDGEQVVDSWRIADDLDRRYPERPALFATATERALARLFERWFGAAVQLPLLKSRLPTMLGRLQPQDRDYFKTTREARLGVTFEAMAAQSAEALAAGRRGLEPLRAALNDAPFLGGDQPCYTDFLALGSLIAHGVATPEPMLVDDDALWPWIERGLDLFGGVGRVVPIPGFKGVAQLGAGEG